MELGLLLQQAMQRRCCHKGGDARSAVPVPLHPGSCYAARFLDMLQTLARQAYSAIPDARCYDALGAPLHILPTLRSQSVLAR